MSFLTIRFFYDWLGGRHTPDPSFRFPNGLSDRNLSSLDDVIIFEPIGGDFLRLHDGTAKRVPQLSLRGSG
jgi:hypothetical protein